MPFKRKRRVSPASKGLAPGEQLKRNTLPDASGSLYWGWVGTQVKDPEHITTEHILATCGFSDNSGYPFCANSYCASDDESLAAENGDGLPNANAPSQQENNLKNIPVNGELDDDVIVISDDEAPLCSKKGCKVNPNCLNYMGQEKWEDEENAEDMLSKAADLEDNPIHDSKDPDLPVGLKNLGATCYANASLQVWFRDLVFRRGVYSCQPSEETDEKYKESPIFQLQVTFAALQESTQSVFNPSKLVESLHLRTTEQQDAQEFSKLFLSHLDAEFQKQSMSSVKSIIKDQFQGKQVYGTICDNCQYRSERANDFLEIEINFENNSKLEDCVGALLQPETLTGDNRYFCSQCDNLQDATRYTELRELPPVLHFSLLRFVYDVSSMERKKSKHSISFPSTIDMNRFLGSESARKAAAAHETDDNVYELRGVLLHKGRSAYHGHYEAQIYDATNQSWYQFNDEAVTKIKTIGDKVSLKKSMIDITGDDDTKSAGSMKKKRANARKRRRVDDSDEETQPLPTIVVLKDRASNLASKDAYMLIYARKSHIVRALQTEGDFVPDGQGSANTSSASIIPTPPTRALDVVKALNTSHDQVCEAYNEKVKATKARFAQLRRKVMDIYRTWNSQPHDESSVVVSQQALQLWLSQHAIESYVLNNSKANVPCPPGTNGHSQNHGPEVTGPMRKLIPLDDILCEHQRLDPKKARSMKRINQKAFDTILRETHCLFQPHLTTQDVCKDCVSTMFKERLYQKEHPRLVTEFDRISETAVDCHGYWISKHWLKDWRLLEPRMHTPSEDDPSPDSAEFETHVRCEHGNLSLNTTNRRRISLEATKLLKALFPHWRPISIDAEPCPVCDALIHISKEDKREIRKRAEEEKAQLRSMYDNALSLDLLTQSEVSCAIIPTQFLKSWKQWLNRPADAPRPETLDNAAFVCEHESLIFDLNCQADLDASITIIKRSTWDVLETFYPGSPLIAIEKRIDDEHPHGYFVHDIPICNSCRLKRMSDWDTTEITIRIRNSRQTPIKDEVTKKFPVTYARLNGARQSKRLRQVKEHGERRRITISKSMTVKDIKVLLREELSIPTICQRLFLRGSELEHSAVTVKSLDIYANDTLELKEENEDHDMSSDSDSVPRKKRRDAERGFGGTLLGCGAVSDTFSPSSHGKSTSEEVHMKACSACTFSNAFDAVSCTICDTLFV